MSRKSLSVGTVLAAVLLAGCSATVVGVPSPVYSASTTDGGGAATSPRPSGAAPAVPAAPNAPVSLETVPWPPATISEGQRADPEVVDFGFTAYDVEYTGKVISYAARVHNPNPTSWLASSVQLNIKFTDDAGRLLYEDDFAVIYTLPPDATSAIGGTAIGGDLRELTAQPTKMTVEVTDVNWFSTDDVAPGQLVMGPATVRPGADDSITDSVIVSCAANSSYRSKLSSGSIAIVFLDAQGRIIGGNSDNTTIDNDFIRIPGGESTPLEMELLFSLPDGVPAAACYPSFNGPI